MVINLHIWIVMVNHKKNKEYLTYGVAYKSESTKKYKWEV